MLKDSSINMQKNGFYEVLLLQCQLRAAQISITSPGTALYQPIRENFTLKRKRKQTAYTQKCSPVHKLRWKNPWSNLKANQQQTLDFQKMLRHCAHPSSATQRHKYELSNQSRTHIRRPTRCCCVWCFTKPYNWPQQSVRGFFFWMSCRPIVSDIFSVFSLTLITGRRLSAALGSSGATCQIFFCIVLFFSSLPHILCCFWKIY